METKPETKSSSNRLEYLDWVRGLGAAVMLQGHVFQSYLKPELKESGPYLLSQFLGGMPPALFLFLTGVTLAFLMDSTERKGVAPVERVTTSLRRAGYLFGLAFAFRLQLWIFGMPAPWQDLFRVDVLNCMGFSIAALSAMALFRTAERIRLCAVLGLAIAFGSPLISQINWSGVPWLVRAYLIPDYNFFGIFPWGAYLAFGMSAGSIIRTVPPDMIERSMQWAAVLGGALILACQYFANAPYRIYAKSEFWLNSPAQILTKLGVTLLLLAFAFLWTRYGAKPGWSWVRQFGTTSLLVYWVHIELIYGRASGLWKGNLNVAQTAGAAVIVVLLMLAISLVKTNRERLKAMLQEMVAPAVFAAGCGPVQAPAAKTAGVTGPPRWRPAPTRR
jgi:Heparan-alpha-glucosaminide N-acetyltransferase, catalytic